MPHNSASGSGAFVPVLAWPGRRPSYRELVTWHEALTASVGTSLPLDLLGLWLHPSRGGPVLVGPAALAADRLGIPPAEPLIGQEALFQLEDRVRAAGYGSVMAVPVRDDVQDVGLLLAASLAPDRYALDHLRHLHRIAASLVATCRRLASHPWILPRPESEDPPAIVAGVTEGLLDAIDRARDGQELVQLASDALSNQLPHDRLELVSVAPAPECWAVVSTPRNHGMTTLDADASDTIDALVHGFGARGLVRVPDLHDLGHTFPAMTDRGGAHRIRASIAVRLEVGGELAGWMFVGSEAPRWFGEDDEAVARLAGRLLAPRVAAWAARAELAGAWS